MELEMRLREQQAETEALRTQKEEERAKAESALCQVGVWVSSPQPPPTHTFEHFLSRSPEQARGGFYYRRECSCPFAATEPGDKQHSSQGRQSVILPEGGLTFTTSCQLEN